VQKRLSATLIILGKGKDSLEFNYSFVKLFPIQHSWY